MLIKNKADYKELMEYQLFVEWIKKALSEPIPSNVVAFNFNISETFSGDGDENYCLCLIGSNWFSDSDSDWACDEIFSPTDRFFYFTEECLGKKWEDALNSVVKLVKLFLQEYESPLTKADAVCVGFVDGDLIRVWPNLT